MTAEQSRLIPLELEGTWRIARGSWQISRDQAKLSYRGYPREDDPNQDGLCLSDHRITDGIFEAEVMVNEVVPAGTNAHLVYRYQDSELYSFAGLGGWEFKYVIAQRTPLESALRQPGWAALVHDAKIQDIVGRRWYPLRVDFSGHNVDLSIGDVCVLRYASQQRSPYYPVGNIGLRGFGNWRTHFRNPRLFHRVRASDVNVRLRAIDLSFIESAAIRAVAERDVEQVRSLDADSAPKAVVVLLGSIAEAIILDLIQSRESDARKCASAKKTSIRRWNLETLIDVAKELKAVGDSTYATSHTLRGYRNLIHPGKPEAQELTPWPSQAVAAIDFVIALANDVRAFHSP